MQGAGGGCPAGGRQTGGAARVLHPSGTATDVLFRWRWVCCAEGRWRLYYAGLGQVGGAAKGIGLAMTNKEDMQEFEGVRVAFRRRV